ncbi:bacillithiol biosynthesis deacetylase BshB1 [Croceiramulus getboli]|nr:bacillithiol biosynthesis deacetylase BshB1 [Flavobacteriaceae bacterium YJPT1-3]
MKVDILAIGAHPDDIELSCAATLAKEIAKGKTVGLLDLTRGELGTRGTPEIRHQEATRAAELLGARFRENCGLPDGFLVNDKASQLKIIEVIRWCQPEIVLCNALEDRHIDHGKGARLASDACFLSGLKMIETTRAGQAQTHWRPRAVYHYIQWKNLKPDFVVDVSGFMDQKLQAVLAYKSQFYDPKEQGDQTPISSENFKDSITYRARDLGRLINTEHAEGFTVGRLPAVDSIFDLI